MVPDCLVGCWSFTSWQHLRSYQIGHWLVCSWLFGWLLEFFILAMSKVISWHTLTCESEHSGWLYSGASLGDLFTTAMSWIEHTSLVILVCVLIKHHLGTLISSPSFIPACLYSSSGDRSVQITTLVPMELEIFEMIYIHMLFNSYICIVTYKYTG